MLVISAPLVRRKGKRLAPFASYFRELMRAIQYPVFSINRSPPSTGPVIGHVDIELSSGNLVHY